MAASKVMVHVVFSKVKPIQLSKKSVVDLEPNSENELQKLVVNTLATDEYTREQYFLLYNSLLGKH